MTRAELIAREFELSLEADNAAVLVLLTPAGHPLADEYAAAHRGLRGELEAVRRELAEMAAGTAPGNPDPKSAPRPLAIARGG